MANYVVLIWEEVPEATKLYLIPQDVADEPLFTDCQGLIVNYSTLTDEQSSKLELVRCSVSQGYEASETWEGEPRGKYADFEVADQQAQVKMAAGDSIVAVYRCGFGC